MTEETTIRVLKETREKLGALGKYGESLDDIIQRIMSCVEVQKRLKELLADFPKIRGYNNEYYKVDELRAWTKKAKKALEA